MLTLKRERKEGVEEGDCDFWIMRAKKKRVGEGKGKKRGRRKRRRGIIIRHSACDPSPGKERPVDLRFKVSLGHKHKHNRKAKMADE